MPKKIILILVILAVVVAVVGLISWQMISDKGLDFLPAIFSKSADKGGIQPPPATTNIDDLVGALYQDVNDESDLDSGIEAEESLLIGESQEINDFGQAAYDSEI